MGTEQALERAATSYARAHGWLSYKFQSSGRAGVPDRLFIRPGGRVLFVEFKSPCGALSPLQRVEIAQLRAQGVAVEVCSSLATFQVLVDNAK